LLNKIKKIKNYLFDQDGDFLAFFFPGFFLSTFLASLVKSQAAFKSFLFASLFSAKALESQYLIA